MAGLTPARRVVLLTALCVAATGAVTRAQTVELRLTTRGQVAGDLVHLASTTARSLLQSAGIEVSWLDCSVNACSDEPGRHVVLISLLPILKAHTPDVSGELLRDGRTRVPIVIVYLPRLVAVTGEMRRSLPSPSLTTLDVGHLVGLTIAHEIGHSLGLPHTRVGVMTARPSIREVIDLRMSRLSFAPRESSRMRMALVTQGAVVAAQKD